MTDKLKVELHVSANFNTSGDFTGYNVHTWKPEDRTNEYGITVWLFQHEVELDVLTPEDMLKAKAVGCVEATMEAARAKHAKRMMALMGLKNRMLCLEAPDVLNAGTSAGRSDDLADDDDRLPF